MPNTIATAEGMPAINRRRAAKREPHPADDLSFMRPRAPKGTGIDYWIVESAGGYGADCDKGRALAREYLDYIGRYPTNGNATLLGCIVNDMLTRRCDEGKLSGIEIAFLGAVNKYALGAAYALAGRAAAVAKGAS